MKQVRRKTKSKKIKMDKFDLFVVIMSAFTIGLLVQKISISGLAWMSTIGYFG